MNSEASIRFATAEDVPTILRFIKALADYERMSDQVVATAEKLHQTLFGDHAFAEVLLVETTEAAKPQAVGFALFFHNYSTFLAQPGIYLEDLYVDREHRGKGYGIALLAELASVAIARNCARLDWVVLDWNEPSIQFYHHIGAKPQDDWTTFRLTGDALKQLAARSPEDPT